MTPTEAAQALAGTVRLSLSELAATADLVRRSGLPVYSPAVAGMLPQPITPADLARETLLHVAYDDPSWTTWQHFLAFIEPDEKQHTDGMEFTSYDVCLAAAERGDGIALGWERSAAPRLDAGALVRIPGYTMPGACVINAYVDEFLGLLKSKAR